ncbi:hypothetical protein [Mechercharimyces sp. CAU 1602]|uniref:hypothetical protein n=1 Tax=Mechercharimyces sp. CAU 1602 TaxID=2973933 RepID=UPI002163FC39|nr:hypothetical protein [Mechercharimyces sp. CAU 1602]MCS1350744.1 hypothetical protein [Mechercharimyces sp. CAU 1602]
MGDLEKIIRSYINGNRNPTEPPPTTVFLSKILFIVICIFIWYSGIRLISYDTSFKWLNVVFHHAGLLICLSPFLSSYYFTKKIVPWNYQQPLDEIVGYKIFSIILSVVFKHPKQYFYHIGQLNFDQANSRKIISLFGDTDNILQLFHKDFSEEAYRRKSSAKEEIRSSYPSKPFAECVQEKIDKFSIEIPTLNFDNYKRSLGKMNYFPHHLIPMNKRVRNIQFLFPLHPITIDKVGWCIPYTGEVKLLNLGVNPYPWKWKPYVKIDTTHQEIEYISVSYSMDESQSEFEHFLKHLKIKP